MECHNYSFFQLFSFSTWEVFLHLMATFKRWFVMTAWAGVAFFKGTSLCQVKWLGLMKMVFLAMTLEAMLCKLMWEVGRCTQSCSHSDVFNWFAMVACFIVNVKENALCSTFLFDRCPQILWPAMAVCGLNLNQSNTGSHKNQEQKYTCIFNIKLA